MDAEQRRAYTKYRSNLRTSSKKTSEFNLSETIVMQCIVSGIIILMALCISFIDTPTTNEIEVSLKKALSEEMTKENITDLTQGAVAKYENLKSNMQVIFGGAEGMIQESESPVKVVPKAETVAETKKPANNDFRIDEDVLNSINGQDIYDTTEKKVFGSDSGNADGTLLDTEYINSPFINPVDGIITSSFGKRVNPILKKEELHTGIDIGVKTGTNVAAVYDGVVLEVGKSNTYGNFLKYKTTNGYTVMYAHLKKSKVKKDDEIDQGEVVALSGNSGLSTGAHLHYSIWKDEELIDPMSFLTLTYTNEVALEYLARGESIN